jgi:hypothetical protein
MEAMALLPEPLVEPPPFPGWGRAGPRVHWACRVMEALYGDDQGWARWCALSDPMKARWVLAAQAMETP